MERVGLYVVGEGRAWFDEIYLGPDFTMGKGEALILFYVDGYRCR